MRKARSRSPWSARRPARASAVVVHMEEPMDIADDGVDIADEEPASQRVLSSIELVGLLLEQHILGFRDRLALHATCHLLSTLVADPAHWCKIVLSPDRKVYDATMMVRHAMRWVPAGAVHSLTVNSARIALDLPSTACRLVELDISKTVIVGAVLLRAAFEKSGPTLRRLNVSGVCVHGYSTLSDVVHDSHSGQSVVPDLFAPLRLLEVLIAYDTEPTATIVNGRPTNIPAQHSMIGYALAHCPCLTTLATGYESEFKPTLDGPQAATQFSDPVWCRVGLLRFPTIPASTSLTSLSLRGYIPLVVTDLALILSAAPPIKSLDLCGCQSLRPENGGMIEALVSIAPTLTYLNVRGTGFDDNCAAALAAANAKITRLNASCTDLTGAGLTALANASPGLQVLDLCYAMGCARDVAAVRAAVTRHSPGLQMIGMGGFNTLSMADLLPILEGNCGTLTHIGIGGCSNLVTDAALSLIATTCPSLTALSAHKLEYASIAALRGLLRRCPALASLDIHGMTFTVNEGGRTASQIDGVVLSELVAQDPLMAQFVATEQWKALGSARVGEHLGEAPQVIQCGERSVVL